MLVRCARVARAASTHARAFYSTEPSIPPQNPFQTFDVLENLIQDLGANSLPPVGTDYPPPRGPPHAKNINARIDTAVSQYSQRIRYSLYCQSTRNNTITTLMDNKCHPVASFTGGSCGFKKVNRSTYEAGYQCAVRIFREIEQAAKKKPFDIDLYFKGFGQGRDAMHKALLTSEGDYVRPLVVSITDRTPIKIGGTRAKKARRL